MKSQFKSKNNTKKQYYVLHSIFIYNIFVKSKYSKFKSNLIKTIFKMKKTINVNISGVAFLIDEDAYDMLDSYLQEIEVRLNSYEEDSDTVKDIEARIAEIFKEHERGAHFVVNVDLVKHVITVIGNPSVFGGHTYSSDSSQSNDNTVKKLTRRRVDRVLAGVCGGLADYFKIDVTIFRVLFVILLIASWGICAIIYLIMWLFIPERNSDSIFNKAKWGDKLKKR